MLPDFEQVRASWVASDAVLLDRRSEPLADLRLDMQTRRLPWVSLQSLPSAMREALLAAEDKRFFEHSGVDWKAFLGAAWQNIWSHTHRGASTLTMQLAGLLKPTLQLPDQGRGRRSLSQKWDQSVAALELEHRWSKPQILEAYINLAPFRGDLVGLGAASQLIFGLEPQQLTRRESVIIAALLRGPNARPALVARRACVLAAHLRDTKLCPQITQLAQTRLDAPRNQSRYTLAPHLARSLLHTPGEQLTSTLDASLQRRLVAGVQKSGLNAGVLVIDNASGEVRAWVGNAQAVQNDLLLARCDCRLWWAPFAAALGIELRSHTAASLLIDPTRVLDARDAPVGVPSSLVSLRTALQRQQTGALQSLMHALPAELAERLHAQGFERVDQLADGNIEVVPALLAPAWRSFAAGGAFLPARGRALAAGDAKKLGTAQAGFITLDMLAESGGGPAHWQSASPDGRTQLVIGSNESMTVLLVLASTDRPERAAQRAQQLWREALGGSGSSARMPVVPDELESAIVVFEPPDEPPRREWFLRGTAIDRVIANAMPASARLIVPLDRQRYLPGKPGQPWTLQAELARAVRWRMDGEWLGSGAQLGWLPHKGMHRVELVGARDEVIDAAEFEVLAAP